MVKDSSRIEDSCYLDSIVVSRCLKVEAVVDTCTSLSTSSSGVLNLPSFELPSLQTVFIRFPKSWCMVDTS